MDSVKMREAVEAGETIFGVEFGSVAVERPFLVLSLAQQESRQC